MQVDIHPTAEASYTRTLMQRGCPPTLATLAGKILAHLDGTEPTPEEQALIARAYAKLSY